MPLKYLNNKTPKIMIFGYVRVSKIEQHFESQKSLIARFVVERKWVIDQWIEVEISSRKSVEKRRITELLDKVSHGDSFRTVQSWSFHQRSL
jgi:DNA invertase Pin-like site-specific DNA recombinase